MISAIMVWVYLGPVLLTLVSYLVLRHHGSFQQCTWWRLLVLCMGVSGWIELAILMIVAGAVDAASDPRQATALADLAFPTLGRALLWTLIGYALVRARSCACSS